MCNWAFNICSVSIIEFLALYDGGSIEAPLIGQYCGQIVPPNLISTSNKVFIHYKSSIGYETGFKLEYHPYSKF